MMSHHGHRICIFVFFRDRRFHVHHPVRRTLDLKVFEDVFENRVPDDSDDGAQRHLKEIAVHRRNAIAAIRRTHL